ncbi:MAG: hypothetical protein ACTSVI_00825 [Promethearchaeota archaeon]
MRDKQILKKMHLRQAFKCALLNVVGLLVTRQGYVTLGIGTFDNNLKFAPLTCFFLIVSLRISEELTSFDRKISTKRQARQLAATFSLFLIVTMLLATLHGMAINKLIFTLVLPIAFFLSWLIMIWMYTSRSGKSMPEMIIQAMPYVYSLVNAALVNTNLVPPFLILFIISFSSSLFIREILYLESKKLKNQLAEKKNSLKSKKIGKFKIIKMLTVMILASLSITFFTRIYNKMMFSIFIIVPLASTSYLLVMSFRPAGARNKIQKLVALSKKIITFEVIALFAASI